MLKQIVSIAFVCLIFHWPGTAIAQNEPSRSPPSDAKDFVLHPDSDVTLMLEEHVEFSVLDSAGHNTLDGKKITWSINGHAIGEIDPALGTLAPKERNNLSLTVVYKAPAKIPDDKKLSIVADIEGPGGSTLLKRNIIIVDEPNWFAFDGDTGIGHKAITVELDPTGRSEAGVGILPSVIEKDSFSVHAVGFNKDDHKENIIIDLSLGPNSQPGTYSWHLRSPRIGADISFLLKHYSSLNFGSNIATLEGATTIIEPDLNDLPGSVKGFYSGRLRWGEHQGLKVNSHYLTVNGHFIVPR